MAKQINLNINVFGSKNITSEIQNSNTIKILAKSLDETSINLKNTALSANVRNNKTLESGFRRVGKQLTLAIKNNFINNPPNWSPLSHKGRKIRGYLLNPSSLAKDIYKAASIEQDNEGIITRTSLFSSASYRSAIRAHYADTKNRRTINKKVSDPYVNQYVEKEGGVRSVTDKIRDAINSLPPIPRHPKMTINKPALLNTGNLMNSVYVIISKTRSKNSEGLVLGRSWDFHVAAPYGESHFKGGNISTPVLVITKRDYQKRVTNIEARIPIPFYWANSLSNLQLGPLYTAKIEYETTQVRPRNPFVLRKQDINKVNAFMKNFGTELSQTSINGLSAERLI